VLLPDSSSTSPRGQARQELHQTGAVSGSGSGCTSGDTTAAPASIAPAETGALVDGVLCGTPAAQAGLFAGDVITSAGGHAVTSPRSLSAILSRCRPGSQIALAWVAPGGSLHAAGQSRLREPGRLRAGLVREPGRAPGPGRLPGPGGLPEPGRRSRTRLGAARSPAGAAFPAGRAGAGLRGRRRAGSGHRRRGD